MSRDPEHAEANWLASNTPVNLHEKGITLIASEQGEMYAVGINPTGALKHVQLRHRRPTDHNIRGRYTVVNQLFGMQQDLVVMGLFNWMEEKIEIFHSINYK